MDFESSNSEGHNHFETGNDSFVPDLIVVSREAQGEGLLDYRSFWRHEDDPDFGAFDVRGSVTLRIHPSRKLPGAEVP